jgi:hypothetical protein
MLTASAESDGARSDQAPIRAIDQHSKTHGSANVAANGPGVIQNDDASDIAAKG